jgi:hypothetical protein
VSSGITDGQGAFHARLRVARDRAEVEEAAGSEPDGERRGLAGCDVRRRLAVDREVVCDRAVVREREDDLAGRDALLESVNRNSVAATLTAVVVDEFAPGPSAGAPDAPVGLPVIAQTATT